MVFRALPIQWLMALVATILSASLATVSSFAGMPCTPAGIQCPTATVQTVTVDVYDCCGHVIGHLTRAPRQGEKGFVQCRCAEKKSQKKDATFSPSLELLCQALPEFRFRSAIPEPSPLPHDFEGKGLTSCPPETPPPRV